MVVRFCLVYDSQGKRNQKNGLNTKQWFMEITQIKLYELVRNKFGEKDSETFVHLIEEKMDTKIDQRTQMLATKDDLTRLHLSLKEEISTLRFSTKEEISALRESTKEEISALRLFTKEEISSLRESTKDDMRKLKDELLRTVYLTSFGQLFAIIASVISLMLLILKK